MMIDNMDNMVMILMIMMMMIHGYDFLLFSPSLIIHDFFKNVHYSICIFAFCFYQELQEDIEESKPTLRKAIDYANDLLADEEINEDEKDDIKKYVEHLTTQLRGIRDEAALEEKK